MKSKFKLSKSTISRLLMLAMHGAIYAADGKLTKEELDSLFSEFEGIVRREGRKRKGDR